MAESKPDSVFSDSPLRPLPDLLQEGLELLFIGINPGILSGQTGRYFAHPRNRFWPAVNAAGIFNPPLSPETGQLAIEQNIGFTDIVKRPTPGVSDLKAKDFREGAGRLKEVVPRFAPLMVCMNGMAVWTNYLRYAEGVKDRQTFGEQERTIGGVKVFVVPSPSPANAAFSLETITDYYQQAQELRERLVASR